MILKALRIAFCALLGAVVVAIMLMTDLIVGKPDKPPKAVGFDAQETIYEDASGNLFKLGPNNRCVQVGKK